MKPSEIGATFQIPKFEAEAELLLTNKTKLHGKLFLSILPSSPLGHSSVVDWLNEPMNFFPFLSNEHNVTEIISKRALMQATIDADLDKSEMTVVLEENVWIERIEVNCGSYSITGEVLLNLPPDRVRVLDFLNQPARFFALKSGSKLHIINKDFITSVKELSALPAAKPAAARAKKTRTKK